MGISSEQSYIQTTFPCPKQLPQELWDEILSGVTDKQMQKLACKLAQLSRTTYQKWLNTPGKVIRYELDHRNRVSNNDPCLNSLLEAYDSGVGVPEDYQREHWRPLSNHFECDQPTTLMLDTLIALWSYRADYCMQTRTLHRAKSTHTMTYDLGYRPQSKTPRHVRPGWKSSDIEKGTNLLITNEAVSECDNLMRFTTIAKSRKFLKISNARTLHFMTDKLNRTTGMTRLLSSCLAANLVLRELHTSGYSPFFLKRKKTSYCALHAMHLLTLNDLCQIHQLTTKNRKGGKNPIADPSPAGVESGLRSSLSNMGIRAVNSKLDSKRILHYILSKVTRPEENFLSTMLLKGESKGKFKYQERSTTIVLCGEDISHGLISEFQGVVRSHEEFNQYVSIVREREVEPCTVCDQDVWEINGVEHCRKQRLSTGGRVV